MATDAPIWMVGPALSAPGGMSAVIDSYRVFGLFDRLNVRYVSTYEGRSPLLQVRVFGRALAQFTWAALRRDCALLHVHSASRGSFWRKSLLCLVSRAFRIPYIVHVHSGEFPVFLSQECGPAAQAWVRWTLRGAHTVLALTPRWRDHLSSLVPGLVVDVLVNPVPPVSVASDVVRHPRSVLFLGRIREKKGAFDLLRAFSRVAAQVPDATLVMAGDGEIDEAQRLCVELLLGPDRVSFTGWIAGDAKARSLGQAGLFVLPSYFEGLPVGILEAMSVGVPVIATGVGGIPDVLRHDESGLLLTPGDLDGLAVAMQSLLTDPARAQRLAAQARRDVQRFAPARIEAALAGIYARALGRRPTPPGPQDASRTKDCG